MTYCRGRPNAIPLRRCIGVSILLAAASFRTAGGENAPYVPPHCLPEHRLSITSRDKSKANILRKLDARTDWQHIESFIFELDDELMERIAQCAELRFLQIQNSIRLTSRGVEKLAANKALDSIWLHVDNLQLDEGAIAAVADNCTELRTLFCGRDDTTTITSQGLRRLAGAKKLVRLSVVISDKLDDDDLKILTEGIPAIEHLTLSVPQERYTDAARITQAGLATLAALPKLTTLSLPMRPDVGDEAVEALVRVCPGLQSLSLGNAQITDKGLEKLRGLEKLKILSIRDAGKITDEGLRHVGQIASLNSLYLSAASEIGDRGLQRLSQMENLRFLSLNDSAEIGDAGLEALSRCPRLNRIRLDSAHKITDEGLRHLAKLDLFELVLGPATEIGDEGFVALSSRGLQSINLESARNITDEGLRRMLKNPVLRTLYLNSATEIGDDGLAALAQKCQNVRFVDLSSARNITKAGVDAFKAIHPDTKVITPLDQMEQK